MCMHGMDVNIDKELIINGTFLQYIAGKVRELLHLETPYWNRTITLPHRSRLGLFLEGKSFTGRRADQLKFEPSSDNDLDDVI